VCDDSAVQEQLFLPGFVNAHSHAFQRALRGRAPGGDFWAWRDTMLTEAERQTPASVRALYVDVYREMLAAGYTAVGEFHYLGIDEAEAAAEAADEAGIAIVIVLAAYARGGLPRFRQDSVADYVHQLERLRAAGIGVAVAPHSVRACPRDWLEELGRFASAENLPLHVHACEQPREVAECVAEYGRRPIELLADTGCLGPLTTVIHATHASDGELDLLADAGARICACPTTEANLGDGFVPIDRICERTIGVCIGSDSNMRIDPLEELREIESVARRVKLERNVVAIDTLLAFGTDEGAAALGIDAWADVEVDVGHRSLRGVPDDGIYEALVLGCCADVLKMPAQ
jgi:formimidoylglutamate deiminase